MGYTEEFQVISATLKTNAPPAPNFFKEYSQPFKIILREDQNFTRFRIHGMITRLNGFTSGKAEIFLNNKKISDFFWPGNPLGFEPEAFIVDQEVALGALKRNEDNILLVEVEQGIIGGDEWGVSLFAEYELNTIDPPEIAPELGDPTEGDAEAHCSPFDIGCLLFGDAKKTTTTVVILAGGTIAVIGLAALAKLIRG